MFFIAAKSRVLFRLISWYHIRHHPLRTALSLLSMTLGVSFVFLGLASLPGDTRALARGFDLATGRAEIIVHPGQTNETAITESRLQAIRQADGVDAAAPLVMSGGLVLGNTELLLFWGIDPAVEHTVRDYPIAQGQFLADPGQILLAERYAAEKRFTIGQHIRLIGPGGLYDYTLAGTLADGGMAGLNGGDLVVLNYADARTLSGKQTIDSVGVLPVQGQDVAAVAERIRGVLPATMAVTAPGSYEKTPADYANDLVVLTLAMFPAVLGALIIASTLAASMAQRFTEIGILRALGLTGDEIRSLFLAESMVIGVVASLLGMVLGYLMPAYRLPASSAASSLRATVETNTPLWVAPLTFILGVGLSTLAGLRPARRATRVDPIEAITRSRLDSGSVRFGRKRVIIGLALMGGTLLLALLADNTEMAPMMVAIGPLGGIAGVALLFPPLIVGLGQKLPPLTARLFGASGLLAAQSLAKRPRHFISTGFIVLMAVTFYAFGSATEQGSAIFFREWLSGEAVWDLMVVGPGMAVNKPLAGIPSPAIDAITAHPAVRTVIRERQADIKYNQHDYTIRALEIDRFRMLNGRLPIEAGDAAAIYTRLQDHQHPAIVVGGYAALSDRLKQVGKMITLETPGGPVQFEIAGVVTIPSAADKNGQFIMDWALYSQLWQDTRVDRLMLGLKPGADLQAERRDLLRQYVLSGLLVADSEALRAATRDQNAGAGMMTAAVFLPFAMLAIANTLFIAILDRRREIGIQHSLGLVRRQIAASVILEVLILVAIACALGIPNAYYTVVVMLLRSNTGIAIVPDVVSMVVVVIIMLLVGALTAYLPARRASRIDILDALHYE